MVIPLGGALFALVHYKALLFAVSQFPSYLFPSIVDDPHIPLNYIIYI
jgi:hypothetical protein